MKPQDELIETKFTPALVQIDINDQEGVNQHSEIDINDQEGVKEGGFGISRIHKRISTSVGGQSL